MKRTLAFGELKKRKEAEISKIKMKHKNDLQDLEEFHNMQKIDFHRIVKIYNTSKSLK
jgi:hypothetical protein